MNYLGFNNLEMEIINSDEIEEKLSQWFYSKLETKADPLDIYARKNTDFII